MESIIAPLQSLQKANNSIHASTKFSPFMANYGRNPTAIPTLNIKEEKVPAAEELAKTLSSIHQNLQKNICVANEISSTHYDKHHLPHPDFQVGDKVWLNWQHIQTTWPSEKLDHIKLGPFLIWTKVGNRAFKLQLPSHYKIHPVFHVSLLEHYVNNQIPNRIQPPPLPVTIMDQEEFQVSEILDSKWVGKTIHYLVDWEGYSPEHCTWEPSKNLSNARELVTIFHHLFPLKPKPQNFVDLTNAQPSRGEILLWTITH